MGNLLDNMEVMNQDSLCCAEVTAKQDLSRKNYDDCNVVFRTSIKAGTALDVAEYITGYIYNNPELLKDTQTPFKFAFPFYGGAVLEVRCTGKNFSDYVYKDMIFVVGLMVCSIVKKHLEDMYHGKDRNTVVLPRVEANITAITNARVAMIENGDNSKLSFPGYDKFHEVVAS